MGADNSTARRITVQEDETTGMVRVSESVARRLLGQPEEKPNVSNQQKEKAVGDVIDPSSPRPPKKLRKTRQQGPDERYKLDQMEKYYKEKVNFLEKQNADLYKQAQDQFVQAIEEVEKKFVTTTSSPVCLDLQTEVLKCYRDNPGKSLNCSPQVTAFVQCVKLQREKLLVEKL